MKIIKILILLLFTFNSSYSQNIIPPNKILTQKEIANKSVSELWLLKNSIYASKKMPFKAYELHAYFMSKPWYKLNIKYKESDLTPTDLKNIDLLTLQENLLRKNDYLNNKEKKQINLDNVYNLFQYSDFNDFEKEKLGCNGFVVLPTNKDQLFHIYENNDYLGIPSFITVDAVLQLYHLFFDMTLRNIETNYLSKKLEILIDRIIDELITIRNKTQNQNVIEAIDYNLAYFGVGQYFIKGKETKLYGNFKDIAKKEIENCKNKSSWTDSELLNRKYDYSQYIPRGHYTRSENLKRYFLSMMWLGNAGIEIENERNILSSVILSHLLYNKTYQNKPLINLWKEIYEPIVFYVGISDDTGPIQIKKAMDYFFPNIQNIEEYSNSEKLINLKNSLPSASIGGSGEWGKQNKQFRLMGQRFVPDSDIFQRLTDTSRKMPNSLDIMAGFGNTKAQELMLNKYKSSWEKMPAYPDSLNKIINEDRNRTQDDWKQNLYYYWLYNLKALFEINNKDVLPFFMTTEGWETKTLNTSLASWAELRHNTILYAKQSGGAECGGDGKEKKIWIPEPPKGYVEPNTEFYERMLSLMNITLSGLSEKNMLDNNLKYIGNEFIDLLSFLKKVSEKEIRKENLSLEEYSQIQKIGSLLDNLTLRVLTEEDTDWWNVKGPDKNMPVIADVHNADFQTLEVGVGKAHEIYVIVEIEGKLKLTRGAIFSFYEFPWEISDRLTDEKWQEMLNSGNAPAQPEWINYKSNQNAEKNLIPLYKPKIPDIPESSAEPGWKIIIYDTGC